MRIYISLPISNMDEKQQREKADKIKSTLSKQGHIVVNPFDIIPDKENPDWYDHIGADLRELAKCDAIYLCNGWMDSKGCRIEMNYAISLGIRTIFGREEPAEYFYR